MDPHVLARGQVHMLALAAVRIEVAADEAAIGADQ